jgi:hypothetical protein
VRAIVRNAAREDYRFASIVMGIAQSDAFRMRSMPETRSDAPLAASRD